MTQNHQLFSVFGSYVPETHNKSTDRQPFSVGPLTSVVIALVLGATISVSTIGATAKIRGNDFGFNANAFSSNQLGITHFAETLW